MSLYCTPTLIEDILNGRSSLDIKNIHENHLHSLLLKVVENWSASVNRTKDTRNVFNVRGEYVTTEKVLKFTQLLKCENTFCEILLLLPEKTKRNLIHELCDVFKLDHYSEFREIFLHQTSTNYSRNVICNVSRLNKSVIHCFLDNIGDIIECNSNMVSSNATCVINFLDNLLANIELVGSYDTDAFSLLNKNGKQQIETLLRVCRSYDGESINKRIGITTDHFKELLDIESYCSVLIRLFSMFIEHVEDMLRDESEMKELFFRVLLKVKHLYYILNTEDISSSYKQNLFLIVKTLVEKSCVEKLVDDGVKNDHLYDNTDSQMLISKWRFEKEKNKKFLLAVCCLDNLYNGYEETLSWLLSYKDMNEKEGNIFVNHLTAYTVNYGSINLIKRFMKILHETVGSSTVLSYSIQQVVVKSLPYLTVKSCNILISVCKEYCKPDESLLWSSAAYTKVEFNSSLNEVFNKLTSDNADNKIFSSLSQLSIISPYVVLQEMIDRIFYGSLNHSVLRNVLLSVSAFYELELFGEVEECTSAILFYMKSSYMKNKKKPTCKNMISIITVLLEVVPHSLRFKFYHTIFDLFLIPNLTRDKSDVFMEMNVTLEIMESLLHHSHIDIISVHDNMSMCKLLLDIINERMVSSDVIDNVDSIVKVMISNLSNKVINLSKKDKEYVFLSISKMLDNYAWRLSFYFYAFFVSSSYRYQYVVSEGLLELCECLDNDMFIPVDMTFCLSDEEIEQEYEVKWLHLFQISYISRDVASYFIDHMPVIIADEEMCNITESVARMLSGNASIGKAKAIMDSLTYIVRKEKIVDIASWLRDDLCNETNHHGICFSMLALIQGFQIYYSGLEESIRYQKHNHVQTYMKIFHLFLLYAKDVEDIKVCAAILLYLFEQLVFNTTLLGEFITNMLALLLMDVLMAILDCIKSLSEDVANQLTEECRDILNRVEGNHGIPLREKFNTTLNL